MKDQRQTVLEAMAIEINRTAHSKGWYDIPREDGTMIALMHSELSEALEALRKDDPDSEKIPPFSQVAEELADVIIRILDYSVQQDLDVPGAVLAKMEYNTQRFYRHGGKAF